MAEEPAAAAGRTYAARSQGPGRRVGDRLHRRHGVSQKAADELHLDADTEGVVITELADDSTAAGVGFQKGDIIVGVNNQKIAKTSDLEKATGQSARLWRITLVRGGQQINVTLGG